jgi:hypothetical protein
MMEVLQRLQAFPGLVHGKSDKEYDKEIQSLVEYLKGFLEEDSKPAEFEQSHLLEVGAFWETMVAVQLR